MFSRVDSREIVSNLLTYGALVLSLSIPDPVWAQVAGATLSGTVTDTSGAEAAQAGATGERDPRHLKKTGTAQ